MIYLASRSPRRRELLMQMGVKFEPLLFREGPRQDDDTDEAVRPGEQPDDYVRRVTRLKAEAAWKRIVMRRGLQRKPVLTADTTVSLGAEILGKPADRPDAERILKLLSGTQHRVATAVAIAAHPKKGAHFAGTTSLNAINGFKAPVSFTVSSNGTALTKFTYSTLGCFGAGGFRPGVNPYTQPGAIIKVGSVTVLASGHFSRTGAVAVYPSPFGVTTKTTTKVSGSFTSPKAARGTVTFTQKDTGKYRNTCGPVTISFTAKTH